MQLTIFIAILLELLSYILVCVSMFVYVLIKYEKLEMANSTNNICLLIVRRQDKSDVLKKQEEWLQ